MIKIKSKKEVEEYFSGEKIYCLICGKLFQSLGPHIVSAHGLSIDEYKTMFNLPWGMGLVSKKLRDKQSLALKKRINNGDKSLMPIHKVAAIGQQAKKRNLRDYDINRLSKERIKLSNTTKKTRYLNAIKILDKAEFLNCPACCVCNIPGIPGIHNLLRSSKENSEIKNRYENLKKSIKRGVEIKTDESYSELKKQIVLLHSNGLSIKEIASEFFIGTTTVKRALRNDGAFK